MLINNKVEQGTVEWLVARLGIPTASRFGDIVTATGKKAAGQRRYAEQLVAERILGEPIDAFQSLEMFQGKALENQCRAAYEMITGHKVDEVGMIYRDEGRKMACSPDGITRLDGQVRGVEMKNVKPNTQVRYLYDGVVPLAYRPQVWGSMWICQVSSWDFVSASIGLPTFIKTVTVEDKDYLKYASALYEMMPEFLELLDKMEAAIQ